MKLLALLSLLAAGEVTTIPPAAISVTAAQTGISNAPLANTPKTLPIDMEATYRTNQFVFTVNVLPGSTTVVHVGCNQSDNQHDSYAPIELCDTLSPSNCKPDKKKMTLSEHTDTLVGGRYYLSTSWQATKRWVQCWADDPNNGTGKGTLTGTRSVQ